MYDAPGEKLGLPLAGVTSKVIGCVLPAGIEGAVPFILKGCPLILILVTLILVVPVFFTVIVILYIVRDEPLAVLLVIVPLPRT
ncbi:hypothetical protein SacN8_11315 [Sulfolobus acidocaldarius N8]|uniref:Uncharacterized protein n=2 Tax=Sulfolobus acidocaldarius TaxID=2285 RepID=M1J548_9CREN|nr:hypothetical protein SacN8_11315 [Sulfolobus acidocaldarius N8]AGE74524.1 hypothetical protein SacRon12I_11560 [Sulfolobus acidocaldarius Ron12/I]WCM33973.1 hypothetical protein GO597_00760 [Sulfolobus acidocaldarius DSM 639]